jgi:hypothetical protein
MTIRRWYIPVCHTGNRSDRMTYVSDVWSFTTSILTMGIAKISDMFVFNSAPTWLTAQGCSTFRTFTHSCSWDLLEKLQLLQLLKNFPAFYGTRRFITVITRAIHWSLSWAKSIQSTPSHPISQRSILISSTHLRLGLPSGLFRSGFPINILYAFLLSPLVLHVPPISSSLTWSS